MSPIGRIFIVLNLVLSAAFLGWAANALSTVKNYKDMYEAEQKAHAEDVAAKETELSQMQVKLNDVTDQQRTYREERDARQAEVDRLTTQLDESKRANEQMRGDLTKIQATLGDYNATIAQLTQQKDDAVERAHQAERDAATAAQAQQAAELAQNAAEEATSNANLQIADLETQQRGLQEQLDTLNTRLEVIVQKYNVNLTELNATPKIEAFVLDVNRDLKLVVLNKGRKDEVKPGYTFDVYRGSTYKGQVRIQDVQEGMSSGLIVTEASSISRGDSATTALRY